MADHRDQNAGEHELAVVTAQQPGHPSQENTGGKTENQFMKNIHQRITKLLTVLFLIVLALVVAALKKQLNLRSDWEQGSNTTNHRITQLQKQNSGIVDDVLNQIGIIPWSGGVPQIASDIDVLSERISSLNKSMIIRGEWQRANGDWYYGWFADEADYATATNTCYSWMGGRLASHILREKDVVSHISEYPVWVGYNNMKGSWSWVDGGETNNSVVEIEIGTKQGDTITNQEYCGFIESKSNGTLVLTAATCDTTMPYICEVELDHFPNI